MKVLVATDGTKHGAAAIESVKLLNLKADDEIHVVTVVDMAVPLGIDIYGGYLPDTTEIEKVAREGADRIIAETTALLTATFGGEGVRITNEILFGSPDSRIVETAEHITADLIVIGSHGYKAWERLLLGSVSDSVVHHAPCSVMIVRTKEE